MTVALPKDDAQHVEGPAVSSLAGAGTACEHPQHVRRFERFDRSTRTGTGDSRELAIDGVIVRIRETVEGEVSERTLPHTSPASALATAEALIASWRAAGFVEIKRVAAFLDEEPVAQRRRFEWVDGFVRRYCEIVQADRAITRIFGIRKADDRDEPGKPRTETFIQIAQASVRFAELGRELAASAAAGQDLRDTLMSARSVALDPAIAATCHDADPASWAVCADWLAERGDPRGTIAGLALGGRLDDARAAIAIAYPEFDAGVTLQHGFVRALSVHGSDHGEVCRRLAVGLDTPLTTFIDELELISNQPANSTDWAEVLAVVVARPQARQLRRLALRCQAYETATERDPSAGLRTVLWSGLPALTELVIEPGAGGNFAGLTIPSLRRLVRRANALPVAELAAIASAAWPALEELELWLGAHNGVRIEELAPILDGHRLPRLGYLGLVNSELADSLVEALAGSQILPRLYALDLSRGTLGDEGAAALVRHARRFRHLAVIDLDDNLLSERAASRIRAVLDNVVIGDQRAEVYGERYVSTGE